MEDIVGAVWESGLSKFTTVTAWRAGESINAHSKEGTASVRVWKTSRYFLTADKRGTMLIWFARLCVWFKHESCVMLIWIGNRKGPRVQKRPTANKQAGSLRQA